ncbi:MAG: hypothetical protein WKF97_01875 [Chitinophagaceae bacterium]
MKPIFIFSFFILMLLGCNDSGSTSGSDIEGTAGSDTMGDTRGMKGTGVDNTGGTPGPGTITDTSGGKMDTADHTSGKDSLNQR